MKRVTAFLFRLIVGIWRINPFKISARNFLISTKIPLGKFYKDFRYRGVFTVKADQTSFRLYNPGMTAGENEVFWGGLENSIEKQSIILWKKACRESEYIFDIGAHTGLYTFVAGAINPDAKIFSFEPSVETGKLLEKNRDLNSVP